MEAQVVDAIRAFLPALFAAAAAQGGKHVADQLATGAGRLATELWRRISKYVVSDPKASKAAGQLAANPGNNAAAAELEKRLAVIFDRNPALESSISQVLIATYGNYSPAVGGNVDSIVYGNQYGDQYYDDELGWWARATGLAKVAVLAALLLFVIGFAIVGFELLQGFQVFSATDQAQRECLAKYPNPGPKQNACMIKAAQQAQADQPPFGQRLPAAFGLLFAAFVVGLVARFLPGAERRRPRARSP
jgi:hypothetical protein